MCGGQTTAALRMHSLSHRSSRFFCFQISLQRAAFLDLLEGLGHLKRLGSRGSAQAGIGHRKTVLQVCIPHCAARCSYE